MNQFASELKQSMTPVYVGKFNLSHHPFSSQFNSTLFYENEARKIISKKISHLLDFTKLILFLQGAEGLGKTTLIRQRLREAKKNWRVCFINATDITTPQALMTKIAEDMGVKLGHEVQVQSLQVQLEAMRQSGQNPILIIDDIEQLNKSLIPTLNSLIQHTGQTQPIIRLVISGQDIPPSLSSIIPKDNKSSMLKYIPLPPLTEKESTDYIKHRLRASGYEYVEPFNKTQLNRIYLDAKGFPIHINTLADHVFSQYALDYENKKPVLNFNENTNKILKIVASALGALVLIFIVFSLFDSDDLTTLTSDSDLELQSLEIPTIFEKSPENISAANNPAKTTAVQNRTKPAPVEAPEIKPVATPEVVKEPVKVVKKEEPSPPATKINPEKSAPKKQITKSTSIVKDINWIKAQNPKHYTLQLIGGSNRDAAIQFIKKHKLGDDAAIVHAKRKGKDWYTVIYKSFESTKLANEASKSLPSALKKIKPWTRSFSAIQKSM